MTSATMEPKDVRADVEPGEERKLLIPSTGDAVRDKFRDDAIRKECGDDVFATTILDAIADNLPDGFERLENYTQHKVFESGLDMKRFARVTEESIYTINAIVRWYRDAGMWELEEALDKVFGEEDEPDGSPEADTEPPEATPSMEPGEPTREERDAREKRRNESIHNACGTDAIAKLVIEAVRDDPDRLKRLIQFTLYEAFHAAKLGDVAKVQDDVQDTQASLCAWYRFDGQAALEYAIGKVFGADGDNADDEEEAKGQFEDMAEKAREIMSVCNSTKSMLWGLGDMVKPMDEDSPAVKKRAEAVCRVGTLLGDALEDAESAANSISLNLKRFT